jgi:hypothetical protein
MANTPRVKVLVTGRVAVETDGAVIAEAQLGGRQVRALASSDGGLPLRAEQVVERRSRKRRAVLLSALTGVIAATVVVPRVVFGHGGSGGRSAVSAADARDGGLVFEKAAAVAAAA